MTLFHALGPFAAQVGVVAAPGMVLLTPTSITHSGTSASIGANGQVTFTAVTSLSLNGVFSATYDNYVISVRLTSSVGQMTTFRMRAAGTDNSTASSYTRQGIYADSTTVAASRTSSTFGYLAPSYGVQRAGFTAHFYGPFLAQPTVTRSISASDYLSAYLEDYACTHNQSTSYDGFTLIPEAGNITGALTVMGVRS